MDTRILRLEEIADELFTIANSFAGAATGTGAVELHRATNHVRSAIRILTEGPTLEDKKSQLREHLVNNNPMGNTAEQIEVMVNRLIAIGA